jgi:signal transduction histidine kinase
MYAVESTASKSRSRTLRQALAWLLAGALIPLLLISTFFLARQWVLQHEASLNRLRDLALALQLSVDRELALDQTALQILATSAAIEVGDWRTFYSEAQEAAKVRPGTWVVLGDRAEKTLINTLVPFGSSLPSFSDDAVTVRTREWGDRTLPFFDTRVLSAPLRTGVPRVSNLFYGPVRQGPVVALSVPVRRKDVVTYALGFAYAPERFVALLQQQPDSANVVMAIIDGNGVIIARNRYPERAIGRVAQPPFNESRTLPKESIVETATFDGVPAFFAHRRSDLTDWSIVVGVPRQDIVAPAQRSLVLWLGVLLTLLFGVTFLAHRFWRRVAIPLSVLASQARALGEREIDMPTTDIEEIKTLCIALDAATRAERGRREETAKRLEVEQREHLLTLQHAEELSAADRRKDEFLAMIGHELRNPLAPIMNGITAMQKLAADDPARQKLQAMMQRQARQLARLIEDVLDLARINAGKIVLRKEHLDLRKVIEEAAQAAEPAMQRRGHAFTVRLPAQHVWVEGDEARLAQIVGNLLDNAAKYTDPGGEVTVALSDDGIHALVRVTDTGRGIPHELLPHVFDLYEQGDLSGVRAGGGLGIGLHVVKRLVEQHAGEAGVSSAGEGCGSVFEVRLPLAKQNTRNGAENESLGRAACVAAEGED